MDRRTLAFLGVGLVAVAGLLFLLLTATKGAHLRLEGKVLKVRTLPQSGGTLVFLDVRLTNPSDVPLVVDSVKLTLIASKGDEHEGSTLTKTDVNNVFQYARQLGPKYNELLGAQDRIGPHQSLDRMVGARVEMSENGIESRRNIRVSVGDIDGAVAEVTERPGR